MDVKQKAGYFSLAGKNQGQPFPPKAGGCSQFRIPGIITLQNGKLFAVADARWDNAQTDYGGIDTIFAISDDNGETWQNGYAAFFPDSDGTPAEPKKVTTCIDPTVVQTKDGVIHIFVNMNPSGTTTGLNWPCMGNGFITVNGKKRLAVTADYGNTNENPHRFPEKWEYYVGDFSQRFAPLCSPCGTVPTHYVDEYYNIYKKENNNLVPLWQKQVGSDTSIVQNLFYMDSAFHVYNTMFTLHLFTADEGKTWHTDIISGQYKLPTEDGVIASPGNGIVTEQGRLYIPLYLLTFDGTYTGDAFMLYSDDMGKTFHRTPCVPRGEQTGWSSESKPCELPNGNIRLFFRNGVSKICYGDYDPEKDAWLTPVALPHTVHSDCNFGALAAGNKIYCTYPEGEGPEAKGRTHGALFVFALQSDCSMLLQKKIPLTEGAFSYSVLTLLPNGNVGVLYDTCGDGLVIYKEISAFPKYNKG